MPTTDDADVFREQWNEHIDELHSIKLSLPADRISDVDDVIDDAKELVELGAQTVED